MRRPRPLQGAAAAAGAPPPARSPFGGSWFWDRVAWGLRDPAVVDRMRAIPPQEYRSRSVRGGRSSPGNEAGRAQSDRGDEGQERGVGVAEARAAPEDQGGQRRGQQSGVDS